ncbi:MAG TPA: hypothetical protein VD965_07475 [Burkholderiales bacterium]|nr:hypothetical protein [Burkholderiales bacterium]
MRPLLFSTLVIAFNAAAQTATVNVDVSGVREQIAKSINVPAERIPVSVQVPATVAADVCKLDPKVFSAQDGANCAARSTSAALNAAVQQQLKG